MHPRIAELLDYIDRQADVLRREFEAVPRERRGERPSPSRWSPAEVVHHVVIVERRITQRLQGLIAEARGHEPESDTSSILTILQPERALNREFRIVTSDANQPRDTDPEHVWSEFETTRSALKDVVATADGLAMSKVSAPHPALGQLNGYGWIAFTGSHAARHAAQIKEDAATA
jgi:DinB family protein